MLEDLLVSLFHILLCGTQSRSSHHHTKSLNRACSFPVLKLVVHVIPKCLAVALQNAFVGRVHHDFSCPPLSSANSFVSCVHHNFVVPLSHLCKGLCGSCSPRFRLSPSHLCKCLCGSHSPQFRLSSLICANTFVSRVCHDFACPSFSSVQMPLRISVNNFVPPLQKNCTRPSPCTQTAPL